jgi:TolA-binding protein
MGFAAVPKAIKKTVPTLAERVKKNLSEDQIYVQVIQSYRTRDLASLEKNTTDFVKAYPASPFADNAIYLRGQLYLQTQKYTEAIRNFKMIAEQYPRGNKFVSAMFAKGQTYKKLNLYDYAEKTFRQVKKDFPGSPEAERCNVELKLIEVRRAG